MKQIFSRQFLVIALLGFTVSSLGAQDDGGGRRPRGFGGGMGFGGGLGGLIAMPEVQKELQLSDEKTEELTKFLEQLRPERGGFQGFQDLSDEEREQRMAELRKQMDDNAKKLEEKVKSTLNEDQWKRVNELRLQREGASALDRDDVAESLKLSAEQKEAIKGFAAELRPQFGRRRGGGDGGERPSFEEMQKRREKIQADLLAVLSPEQREVFEGMKGKKFEFPERQRGGGSRRGQRPAAE